MKLYAELATSLAYIGGIPPELEAAWTKTLEFAERLDDPDYRLRAAWELWCFNRGSRWRHATVTQARRFRALTANRADPNHRRAQIVDMAPVLIKPSGCGPPLAFAFGPLEQLPVVLRVGAREPSALTAFAELFARIGARRVEQAIAPNGTLDFRRDERFRDQPGEDRSGVGAAI